MVSPGDKGMSKRRWPRPPVRLVLTLYAIVATGLGLLLGWLVIRNLQWSELGRTLASATFPLLVLALAMTLVAGYLRGLRWRLLLARQDVSALRLFFIEQAGSALDTLSPVRVLDEVVEVGILTVRDRLNPGTVLATLAMQRTYEFITTVLLLTGGALMLPQFRQFWAYLLAGMAASAASIIALFTIGPIIGRLPFLSRLGFVREFASAVGFLRREKGRSALAFLVSIVQAALVGLAGWVVGVSTGLSLSIPAMVVITLGVMFFSSAVPGLPMALGTFEFAAVGLLGLWDTGRAAALGFALVLHAVLFLPPIFMALIFLPKEGLFSVKEIRRLATVGSRER